MQWLIADQISYAKHFWLGNNRTSTYVRIAKISVRFTVNKNLLIYTKYTCVLHMSNFCLYIIHVHSADNVRPQQWWPHALSNKLQVFFENLQVFYENLQVFYGI